MYHITASGLNFRLCFPCSSRLHDVSTVSCQGATEGRLLLCGNVLIDLKQQISNCRYSKRKLWWQTTGQVIFGGWDQSHELVRLLKHMAAWPGLQAVLKAEFHFPRVCNRVQKRYLFLEVHFVVWDLGSVGLLHPRSPCHPARACMWSRLLSPMSLNHNRHCRLNP